MVVLLALLFVGMNTVAVVAATELLIREKVLPNDRFIWHLNLFRTGGTGNVVFGDSQASFGIHGLSGFLNLSYPDDSYTTTEAKVQAYFANRRPGKVILQADPHMLSPSREITPNYDVRLFANRGNPFLWVLTGLHRGNIIKYWSLFLRGSSFSDKAIHQSDGAITQDKNWLAQPEDLRLSVASDFLAPRFWPNQLPNETENGRAYERTLAFLISQGAEVCMVRMPLAPLVQSLIVNSANDPKFRRAQSYYQSLAAKYGATYVDMSGALKEEILFLDERHLNEAGARSFLPILETACHGDPPAR